MKVPIYDDATVAPSTGVNSPGPNLVQADQSLAQGFKQAGAGINSFGRDVQEYGSKIEAQAQAQREAEALAEYQKSVNARLDGDSTDTGKIDAAFDGRETTGFMSTRGDQAHAQAGDVLKGVEEDRQRIRDTLPPLAQKAFEQRSQAMLLEARHRVESHSAQQFEVSKQAAAKGLEDTTVAAAASDYNNPFAWVKTAEVEKSIRALQLSPEDGDAKVATYKQKIAMAQIGGALAAQDIAFAETRYEASKEALGTQAVHVRAQIDEKKKALEAKAMKAEAEDVVAEIVQKSLDPDGYLNENKAHELLKTVPADKRTVVRELLKDQARLEVDRKTNDIERWRNQAQGMFNAGGGIRAIEPETMRKLHTYDTAFEKKLMDEQRMQDDHWRKLHSTSKSERNNALREQKDRDKNASDLFLALEGGTQQRATVNLETFVAGLGVSKDLGMSHLKRLQQEAKDQLARKSGAASDSFVRDVEREVKPVIYDSKKKGKLLPGVDAAVPTNYAARAVKAFHDFEVKHKRVPDEAEQREMIGDLRRNATPEDAKTPEQKKVLEKAKGFFSDTPVPVGSLPPDAPEPAPPAAVSAAHPPAAAAPAPATKRRIVTNAQTKERRYLNADGTLGEVAK